MGNRTPDRFFNSSGLKDPVLPDLGAFAFVRDADKPSNVNNQDNHS
jgi:hypothetical protein